MNEIAQAISNLKKTEQALEDWSSRFYQDNKQLLQKYLLFKRLESDPEYSDFPETAELVRLAKIKIYAKIKESIDEELTPVLTNNGHTFFFRLALGRFADLYEKS